MSVGGSVYVLDLPAKKGWIPGIIVSKHGSKLYMIELRNGCVVRRHIDHVRPRIVNEVDSNEQELTEEVDVCDIPLVTNNSSDGDTAQPELPKDNVPLRRSTRVRNPPNRLTFTS